jgi:2-polyprenyl-3-methyl-5-hydroxy-6-metoxy-1,4-benzoquinol methylase
MANTRDESAECIICGANAKIIGEVTTGKKYEVAKCQKCAFVFTLPRPSVEELIAHYDADYFTNSNKETGYGDYYRVGEMNMRAMWPVFKSYVGLGAAEGRAILDVGCASGAFLSKAQSEGWKAKGVELSEDAVKRARVEYHLEVYQDDIFCDKLETASFNVLTMWHSLEHTLKPLAELQRAHDLLVPSGLCFIELPNWNSLGRIAKGTKWNQLVPPAHLNFFTKESITFALKKVGFEDIKCSTHHIAGFTRLKSKVPGVAKASLSGIEAWVEHRGNGGYLRAVGRKSPK